MQQMHQYFDKVAIFLCMWGKDICSFCPRDYAKETQSDADQQSSETKPSVVKGSKRPRTKQKKPEEEFELASELRYIVEDVYCLLSMLTAAA